jgi:hypothetical protein
MLEDTAEADWKRNGLYGGPVFEELDEVGFYLLDDSSTFESYTSLLFSGPAIDL